MDRPASTSGAEQTFIEQMPALVAVFDCQMRYVAVSQRFLSDMAYLFAAIFTPAEVIGLSHYEMFPNMPARWRDIHTRVLRGEAVS
jgi:PAS fold